MKRLTVFCIATLFIYNAHAQSPMDAKTAENLEALIKASNYNDGWLATALTEVEKNMKERIAIWGNDKPISQTLQAQIDATRREILETMREMLSFEKMKPGMIQAMTDTFTVNEIASLRKLYESEEWKLLELKRRTLFERNAENSQKALAAAAQMKEQKMQELKATLTKE